MKESFRPVASVVRLVVSGVVAMAVLGGASAYAQLQPQISYILPPGGQRGTTVDVKVRGRSLVGATQIYISGHGVTGKVKTAERPTGDKTQPVRLDVASNPDMAYIEVAVAPDALAWKAEKLPVPLDQLTGKLESPENVGKAIAGEKIKPPVLK